LVVSFFKYFLYWSRNEVHLCLHSEPMNERISYSFFLIEFTNKLQWWICNLGSDISRYICICVIDISFFEKYFLPIMLTITLQSNSNTFLSGFLKKEIFFELFRSVFAWDTQLYIVPFKTCANLL
jgi:hypothetical protein